ncbi:MAG: type III secretion protein [Paraburkholderia sp.]|nr:type III secretion protein [Paraburkholderia sp.]
MYEQLEPYGSDFNDLQKTLVNPAAGARIDAIRTALDATAQQISETQGASEIDRNNLAKLYRGFLAASRIVARLQEKQALAPG